MQTAAELEIGDSSTTSPQSAGQYSGQIIRGIVNVQALSSEESISGEVLRESTQELSESSVQQTTQTSTQETTHISLQQTSETSTVQAFAGLEIEELGTTFTDPAVEYGGQQITRESIDVTHTSGGKSMSGETVPQSTRDLSESSTQKISHTSTQQTTQTSTQQIVQEIQVFVGEEMHGMCEFVGEETAAGVIGQTAIPAAQESTSSSLECVHTATESTDMYESSSKEVVQTSAQQSPAATEMTVQLAVTGSEPYGRKQSLDMLSSSVQNITGATTQEIVQGTMVESVGFQNTGVDTMFTSSGTTGLDIQFGKILYHSTQEIRQLLTTQTLAATDIRDLSATITEFAGQYGGENIDPTILPGGHSIREFVTGKVVRSQEHDQSLTQQTTHTSALQTTQTSTQQTVQASAELEIGKSTNRVTSTESAVTYGGQVGADSEVLRVTTLPGGESERLQGPITDETVRKSTEEIRQSSTQLTTQTGDLIDGGVITLRESNVEDYVPGPRRDSEVGMRLFVEGREHGFSDSEGDQVSSTVIRQTVAEAAQENASSPLERIQTATELADMYGSSWREIAQTSIQRTSTALETAVQHAVTKSERYGREQSLDMVSSSVKNISTSTMQETAQGATVESASIENKNVDATLGSSGATGFNVHFSDLKSEDSSATFAAPTGQYGTQVAEETIDLPTIHGAESMIVRESMQKLNKSLTRQTTHASAQHTTETSIQHTAKGTVAIFEQYGGEKSSDIVSSPVMDVLSSLKHHAAQRMTVEAVVTEHNTVDATFDSSGTSGLNIQSEDITAPIPVENSNLDITSSSNEGTFVYSVTSEQEGGVRTAKNLGFSPENNRVEANNTPAAKNIEQDCKHFSSMIHNIFPDYTFPVSTDQSQEITDSAAGLVTHVGENQSLSSVHSDNSDVVTRSGSATAVRRVDTSVSADQIQEAVTEQVVKNTSHTLILPAGERVEEFIADQIFRELAEVFPSSPQGVSKTSTELKIENSSERVVSNQSSEQNEEQVPRHVLDATILPEEEGTPKPVTSIAWESAQELSQSSTQESARTSVGLTVENSSGMVISKVRESGSNKMVRAFI